MSVVTGSGQGVVLLHRMIVEAPRGEEVDHRDCDPLNNRRSNLRLATRAQNAKNRRRARSNRLGFKGVYREGSRRRPRYRAEISVDGKKVRLGSFASPEQAHAAYRLAAVVLHGEFHRFG